MEEAKMVRPARSTTAKDLRIAEIRRQIAAGVYETPDKLSAALDAFLCNPERTDESNGSDAASSAPRPR
jgi:hypothetical protein